MEWQEPNAIYRAMHAGWSRTRIIQWAMKAGAKVDIKATLRRLKEDPTIFVVMENGEEFHGRIIQGKLDGFHRTNPYELACIGILPGLQI